jgi:hypothetical protein
MRARIFGECGCSLRLIRARVYDIVEYDTIEYLVWLITSPLAVQQSAKSWKVVRLAFTDQSPRVDIAGIFRR